MSLQTSSGQVAVACSWLKSTRSSRAGSNATFLDDESARQARLDAGVAVDGPAGSDHSSDTATQLQLEDTPSRKRGPQDSGKGVRLMVGIASSSDACLQIECMMHSSDLNWLLILQTHACCRVARSMTASTA